MEQLGIELPVLVTQVVNFAILAALLWKFLYKPVLKHLDARKQQLEADQKLSHSLKEQQAELDSEKKNQLKLAHTEAQEIITTAKKDAKTFRAAELEAAKVEIAKERAKLIAEVEAVNAKLKTNLKHEAVELAIALTKKVLSESLDSTAQADLIKTSLANFSKLNVK